MWETVLNTLNSVLSNKEMAFFLPIIYEDLGTSQQTCPYPVQ